MRLIISILCVGLPWMFLGISQSPKLFLGFLLGGTSFACVDPWKGRNQGVLSLGGWEGYTINLGNMSDFGDICRMTKALCSIGHSSAQTGERLFLRSKTSPISPALLPLLWADHFLGDDFFCFCPPGPSPLLVTKAVTTAQSWPTGPPPENSRSHGDFKLYLHMWDEPPEVSSICLNLRRARIAVPDPAILQVQMCQPETNADQAALNVWNHLLFFKN